MNTEPSSPIMDSRHHDTKPDESKKPNAAKYILLIVAVLIFTMGLAAVFFVSASDQQDEQLINAMEKAAVVADEE